MQAFHRIVALNGSLIKMAYGYYRHSVDKPEPALSNHAGLSNLSEETLGAYPPKNRMNRGFATAPAHFPMLLN
jgi:hypothetical protein